MHIHVYLVSYLFVETTYTLYETNVCIRGKWGRCYWGCCKLHVCDRGTFRVLPLSYFCLDGLPGLQEYGLPILRIRSLLPRMCWFVLLVLVVGRFLESRDV